MMIMVCKIFLGVLVGVLAIFGIVALSRKIADCRYVRRQKDFFAGWDAHARYLATTAIDQDPVLYKDLAIRQCVVADDFNDGMDVDVDGNWYQYCTPEWTLSCGHTVYGSIEPNFCSICGCKVNHV